MGPIYLLYKQEHYIVDGKLVFYFKTKLRFKPHGEDSYYLLDITFDHVISTIQLAALDTFNLVDSITSCVHRFHQHVYETLILFQLPKKNSLKDNTGRYWNMSPDENQEPEYMRLAKLKGYYTKKDEPGNDRLYSGA